MTAAVMEDELCCATSTYANGHTNTEVIMTMAIDKYTEERNRHHSEAIRLRNRHHGDSKYIFFLTLYVDCQSDK